MLKDIHSISHRIIASALSGVMLLSSPTLVWAQSKQQPAAQQPGAAAQNEDEDGIGWPRTFTEGNLDYTLYEPQIDSWSGDKLEARAAIAVKAVGAAEPKYGVAWITANTLIDRQGDTVRLSNIEVTKVNFPSDPGNADSYAASLRTHIHAEVPDVSLASLQSALAVSEAEKGAQSVEIKNDPPVILFSEKPAFLVRIDGKPVLRQITGSAMLRVINTTALITFDEKSATYYLRAFKHWYSSKTLDNGTEPGNWERVATPTAALASVLKAVGQDAATFDTPPSEIATAVDAGRDPLIYVATKPTELLQTTGDPDLLPIPDTKLLYVKNTTAQILIDEESQTYYVLLSGRWFQSNALNSTAWQFVPNDKLPEDFAKIPENHPKGEVLASVSGTPQAKEALIDNSIPQMAEVDRSNARLTVQYDGDPQMKPIDGTKLQYVANASVPVILATNNNYYAVQSGVWFVSASLNGPWAVASDVPAEIYGIPASSPLHYVTYVHVYGSSPKKVYVGYTPGYCGTVVSPSHVVVYGTGYNYEPWVADTWYPAPATYGYGEDFAWGALTGFVFGAAIATAAWSGGPWGWGGWGWGGGGWAVWGRGGGGGWAYWGGGWGPGWHPGWGPHPPGPPPGPGPHPPGPPPGGGQFSFNNANIYNRWQHNAVNSQFRNQINNRINGQTGDRPSNAQGRFSPEQRQNFANQVRNRAGNLSGQTRQNLRNAAGAHLRGSNNLFAGHDGHVYRRGAGGWEQHANGGWNRIHNPNIGNRLNADQMARFRGNAIGHFRNFGGLRGGALRGGFRGGGFHGFGGFRR